MELNDRMIVMTIHVMFLFLYFYIFSNLTRYAPRAPVPRLLTISST